MLMLALTPTLARALDRTRGDVGLWVEVCSLQGMKLVALQGAATGGAADDVDGDVDGAMVQASGDLEHCPDCSLAHHELAPPPTLSSLVLASGADYLAPLFLQAPRTLFAWRGPPSRAPPLRA
ncbi:conserved hypothetical protein [Rubrivivax sp. A210]|nr:conserved hypothetical protein [Rubrivivax sp. A210]